MQFGARSRRERGNRNIEPSQLMSALRSIVEDGVQDEFRLNRAKRGLRKQAKQIVEKLHTLRQRVEKESEDLLKEDYCKQNPVSKPQKVNAVKNNMEQPVVGASAFVVEPIICSQCGKVFIKSYQYGKHLKVVHKMRIRPGYFCQLCPYYVDQGSNFTAHLMKIHCQQPADDGPMVYICPLTGKSFRRGFEEDSLRTFINYTMTYCRVDKPLEYKYDEVKTLADFDVVQDISRLKKEKEREKEKEKERLLKKEKPKEKEKQPIIITQDKKPSDDRVAVVSKQVERVRFTSAGEFICTFCQNSFTSTHQLAKHLMKERNVVYPNYYFCPKCFQMRKEADDMAAHLIEAHGHGRGGPKTYVCKYTGKDFQDENDLKWHIKKHFVYSSYFTHISIPALCFQNMNQDPSGKKHQK